MKKEGVRDRQAVAVLGTLFAALGVLVASVGLFYTGLEVERTRITREAMLQVTLLDRLREARDLDEARSATACAEDDSGRYLCRCAPASDRLEADLGQVEIVEAMVRQGISLRDLEADKVNLAKSRPGVGRSRIWLAGADLVDADLHKSNLRRADLAGAQLARARLSDSCLEDAQLNGADLRYAVLQAAVLRESSLVDANLRCANLSEANLRDVDFTGAILTNADLTMADLRGAAGLDEDQLQQACADAEEPPQVPEGLEWRGGKCGRSC